VTGTYLFRSHPFLMDTVCTFARTGVPTLKRA
jgi:hypothetical protein